MVARKPIDRGWAWVVLVACFIRAFMVIGMGKSIGMFFVEYIDVFDSNSSMISVVISTQQMSFSIGSFFVLTVGNKFFTFRPMIIFGSILMASGYFLTSFAPNVYVLLLSQGILSGFGQAAVSGPSVVVLNTYFDKKRGLANSLSNSGGSLGGLILPLAIQALLETYALRGAQIVVAGLLLNIVVAGSLLRPMKKEVTEKTIDLEVEIPESKQKESNSLLPMNMNNNDFSLSADDIRIQTYRPELTENGKKNLILKIPSDNYRSRTFSENLHENRYTVNTDFSIIEHPKSADESKMAALSNIFGSLADVSSSVQGIFLAKSLEVNSEIPVPNEDSEKANESCFSIYCLKAINFKILKNHRLKCMYAISFLAMYGTRLLLVYIPPYAKDQGISSRNISYLVTMIGACDFVGRFAVAWIADSKRIKRNHIIAGSLIIVGILSMCNSFVTDFTGFIVYSVIYGLFGGVYQSMIALLLVEAVGPKHLSTALAFSIQINSISISGMAPLLGLMRDKTGSYTGSFYVIGVGMLLSATILLFVEPFVKKLEHKRRERNSVVT